MSTDANPLKKPAEDLVNEEPNPKKAKVSDEPSDNLESTAETKSNNNEHHSNNNTPSKVVNGSNPDKSSQNDGDAKARNHEDVDDDEGDDDDDDDDEDDVDGVFDPKIANCLEQVEGVQLEICNLNEKASEEILKVEQKFNKLRRPHFEKRNELLKGIPNFWLTSMANHPIIAPMIESAEDEDCLHYLINLDVEEFEDIKSGYRFKLQFAENPYIANEVIVKQFQFALEDESTGSTQIEFKNTPKGQKLKQIVDESLAQRRRSRRLGQGANQHQSFFAWLSETCEATDEVADSIKEQIWPNPLDYFFAAPEEEYGEVSDEESDDEDEEIDDEDLEDDDAVAVIDRDSGSEIELGGSDDDSVDEEDIDDEELE